MDRRRGAVVLRHDKPGCGGSPGHWTDQTLVDRAHESLAAVDVLRRHPAVAGQPVGLYGISQGGWVSLIAAATEPDAVDFVVSHSGPGVSPVEQERDRLMRELRASDLDDHHVSEALTWVDERAGRLLDGSDPAAILADQRRHADRPWYEVVTRGAYHDPAVLAFAARIFDFDPATVLPDVICPVLALFGGADTVIPVPQSVAAFARHLPPSPHGLGLAVFPGADHGMFLSDPEPGVARRDQLAPAFLPTITAFLASRPSAAPSPRTARRVADGRTR